MATKELKLPLIVIVGPTASGKTALSIELAKKYNGEIISADSRAIYKGADIGTAKPSLKERQGVPHWGFDLATPGQRYTAAQFQLYAKNKIAEIRQRGHIPILVGGTGLYVDAIVLGYKFPPEVSLEERQKWEQFSLQELHNHCTKHNIKLPENSKNKRYVINTIVRNKQELKRCNKPAANTIVVGITTNKIDLKERIRQRALGFLNNGVVNEAKELVSKYGWKNTELAGNIYPLIKQFLDNQITYEQMMEMFQQKEWQLAKRQLTWLRRNEYIKWLTLEQAYKYLAHTLDSLNKS